MYEPSKFKPITAADWQQGYESLNKDPSLLLGYMDCARRSATELFQIIEKAKNFEELKEQIVGFAQQQVDLINEIDDKWYGDDPWEYDLPPFSYDSYFDFTPR